MERPLLSVFLRGKIKSQYGSVRFFADSGNVSYERIRKAIQRNRFSKDDLNYFVEKLELVDIDLALFEYSCGRRTNRRFQRKDSLLSATIEGIVSKEHLSLVINNPIILERVRAMVADELRRIIELIGKTTE